MATAVRKLSRNNKSRSKRSGSSGGGASRAIGLLLALILVGGGVYAYMNPEIIEQAKAGGIELQATGADSLAAQPNRLEVQITDARSYGSAFTGHYKSMHIRLTRYENGQQTATTELSRRSLGGMGGMFKSSCSVLERVTDTLAKDTAAWLKNPADASATPAANEASGAAQ